MTRIRLILLATAAALSLGLARSRAGDGRAEPRPSRVEGEAFTAPSNAADGNKPAETEAPNAGYKPLLPNQTRAPTAERGHQGRRGDGGARASPAPGRWSSCPTGA